ncbi:MAG: L-fucose/L-arabinose isomerase family protein [Candidatus Excrementavichristensenella sp.]|nr:fucose isomerase [Bacillota bacterium]NLL54796.1 fucose isomerase [Clostridiales bacterium]
MINIPEVKVGVVAVSRDCFPIDLSRERRKALAAACKGAGVPIVEIETIIESELDALQALKELKAADCNALVVYLGNFGPEGPETYLAERFGQPCMFCAAAEENIAVLSSRRGDAYCGLLNASYNIKLRRFKAYIPENPVGDAEHVKDLIADFIPIARAILGIRDLKIITFGPRPYDFLACNAPIGPLFKLGINVQENSELDLFAAYNAHKDDPRIPAKIAEMEAELGEGNKMPGILPKLAQYELTLLDWVEANRGSAKYVAMANKCWPAFQTQFGFVPCYVNSRLTAMGIPVACEVDIYGALSEFIGTCVTQAPVTLLDINNTVPADMYKESIEGKLGYTDKEVFMGFHCGNTPMCRLKKGTMKYQLIMHRGLEPGKEPDITRGTLEGDIVDGPITFFRLQADADSVLKSYIAEGEVLPVATQSFGGIGVFGIPEMSRFYRHVLIEDGYPHHGAVAFGKAGKYLFEVFKWLGATKISFNRPKAMMYPTENPFEG